jgi:hypothetical protein
MAIKRERGLFIPTKKYAVLYGQSVYYPYQDEYTWSKEFDTKKEARGFIQLLSKRQRGSETKYDFVDFVEKDKQLQRLGSTLKLKKVL